MNRDIHAVFFDFGGVITESPFEAFARHERARGLPEGFIRRVNSTNPDTNAWALFERGEIGAGEFDARFRAESAALGHALPGREVLPLLATRVRPYMPLVLDRVRAHWRIACLTNNVATGHGPGMSADADAARAVDEAMARFELVLESSKAGARKPEPRFYETACALMQVEPVHVLFLDDLGINLKPARAMGMRTIKVERIDRALAGLADALDFPALLTGMTA